jgi:hypothetical protein
MMTDQALPLSGRRIRLIAMPDDPDPLPRGSIGTVESAADFGDWQQITVRWNNGRTLRLCCPPDVWEYT